MVEDRSPLSLCTGERAQELAGISTPCDDKIAAKTNKAYGEVLEGGLKLIGMDIYVVIVHGIKDGRCTCGSTYAHKYGKHPIDALGSWKVIPTTEVEQFEAWLRRYPFANLAIPAEINNLIILDFDNIEIFNQLFKEHPSWFVGCWIERTGRGLHVYFRQTTPAINHGCTTKGIEVKILNYVVCSPSRHIDGGRYEWMATYAPWERAIEVIPVGLLNWIYEDKKPSTTTTNNPSQPMEGYRGEPPVVDDMREATPEQQRRATVWLNHYALQALKSRDRTHNMYHCAEQCRDNDVPLFYTAHIIAPLYAEIVNGNIKEKEPFPAKKAIEQVLNAYRKPRRAPAIRRKGVNME
jgi:hypothetical protein